MVLGHFKFLCHNVDGKKPAPIGMYDNFWQLKQTTKIYQYLKKTVKRPTMVPTVGKDLGLLLMAKIVHQLIDWFLKDVCFFCC